MKKILLLTVMASFSTGITAQTLIASSHDPNATTNHNQRKIIRDADTNICVVYTTILVQKSVIKRVIYDRITGQWSQPMTITVGKNPTLSIDRDGRMCMLFEFNDSVTEIKYSSSADGSDWTAPTTISDPAHACTLPVADMDSSGCLNAFWIQKNDDSTESLVYACMAGDSLVDTRCVTTKDEILDVAVANHLQYLDNNLLFAIQFNGDSLQFFTSSDRMVTCDTLYAAMGSRPCISYNTFWYYPEETGIRLLFVDVNSHLTEVETISPWGQTDSRVLNYYPVDDVCIDDIAPPLGYSFLFLQNGILYHGFSYGVWWSWVSVLDTTNGNNISHPSMAYKHFSPLYADFIWMEGDGDSFNIVYKQDDKYIWTGMPDPEPGKGFYIAGYPNPFTDRLTLTIHVEEETSIPVIQIYSTHSELIKTLTARRSYTNHYSAYWDGDTETGVKVKPGVYIIMCSVGDKRTARKVIFKP